MPLVNEFSNGWHLRPLLDFSREQILNYASTHQLSWVEDPSNQSDQYDRNYLRHHVLPLLQQRWPSVNKTLSIAAYQQAENESLISQLAAIDLSDVIDDGSSLSVEKLNHFDEPRIRNILRLWIKRQGLPVPPRNVMQQIMQQMFTVRDDADPVVKWSHAEMHRYKQRLYVVSLTEHDENKVYQWQGDNEFFIESLHQYLYFKPVRGNGLKQDIQHRKIIIKFRQGGEAIKIKHRDGTHKLKKLFQEVDVPPWMRNRIPLLYIGDELIAVVGYWLADEYACADNETGLLPMLKNKDD
jgi:tRNA(Ile)-lysidine synthase